MKKGIVLPMVLVLLLVLGMLGYAFNRLARTEFRQAYFISDNLRAQYLAEAALQEALADLRLNMNNDEFRENFIEGEGEEDLDVGNAEDLDDDMEATENDATTNRANIDVSAKAEWVNQTPIGNDSEDTMGNVVITVHAEVNDHPRDLKVVYDYKCVDVRPVGNEYTFMVDYSQTEAFNNSPLFYTKATGSEGISIGGSATINLAGPYETHPEWEDLGKNIDLHPDGDTEDSLIPGGGQKHWNQKIAESVETNEPWEETKNGTLLGAKQVDGGDKTYEPTTSCGAEKRFEPKGNFPFNCGYLGGNSYTHFFYKNCQTGKDTKMHGDIKKRYSVKEYEFHNIGHVCPKESCSVKNSTPYSKGDPCPAHKNFEDWTGDDTWKVVTLKDRVEKEYKTTGEYESSAISKDGEINFKGDFNEFMKSASRVVGTPSSLKEWPGDEKDTYISHGKLYLEGIVACETANFPEDIEYRTPGMIVSQSDMQTQKRISPGDKVEADGEEFFEQESILGLVAFGSIKDASSKEQVGFYTDQKFENSNMKIKGNLVIDRLNRKEFGGELEYGDKLNSSDVNIDDGKCMVITLSPIPSAYIVLNNVGGE